jgi:hypothetical protein
LLLTIVLIIGSSVLAFQFARASGRAAHLNAVATLSAATAKTDAATVGTDAATTTALTAVAGTEMAISHATATMAATQPDPYANGRLVLSDNLASDQSTTQYWMLQQDSACFFQNNAYHSIGSSWGCNIETTSQSALFFDDFTLEVKMTILQGDLGGITFRAALSDLYGTEPRYHLVFDKDGNYQFNADGGSGPTLPILGQGNSSAFNTGYGQTNTIALVARGSTFTWYVNHQQAGSLNDTRFKRGAIDLLAALYGGHTGSAEVAYTDLRIWRL